MTKLLIVVSLILSSFSFGSNDQVSWEQLKDSCVNFTNYGYQLPPSNVRVSCSNVEMNWEVAESTPQTMSTYRYITANVITDKNEVSTRDYHVENPDFSYRCPSYREVQKSIELERATSCTEITNFQGTLEDFCRAAIEDVLEGNPDAQDVTPTGNTHSGCVSGANTQRPGGNTQRPGGNTQRPYRR